MGGNFLDTLKQTTNVLADALFPRRCVRCCREGGYFCSACQSGYVVRAAKPRCPFCAKKTSGRTCSACVGNTYLDGLSVVGEYADPVLRKALEHWKYDGDPAAGEVVRRFLCQSAKHLPDTKGMVLSYIPLHIKKRRSREFDQAERLAGWHVEIVGGETIGLLKRVIRTRSQAQGNDRRRQLGELDEIFEVVGDVPERVLLWDDVFTTGATLDSAARTLKEAGVREVWGCVFLRGGG